MRPALFLAAVLAVLPVTGHPQDRPASGTPQPGDAGPGTMDVPNSVDVPNTVAPGSDLPPDQQLPPEKPLPPATPAPPPPTWQPRGTAILQALDKIDGQSSTLTVAVGQKQIYRNITIGVMSCYSRPPDQPLDATAYLVIRDNSATEPNFVGWMLAAEPSSSMMEHPVYDVRVLACR